ncbi:MAG: hypothetical protein ABL933_03590 [Methyloglobulus sp.]|nr:hypothetical protein [Methyloglobulus sp.]
MQISLFRGVAVLLCVASTAHAGVLLERSERQVFGSQFLLNQKCTINVNEANPLIKDKGQLIKQYDIDGMLTKEITPMQLSADAIKLIINQAATGKITVKPYIFDSPIISHKAYWKTAAGPVKTVILHESNGYNAKETSNDSPAVQPLIALIEANCK